MEQTVLVKRVLENGYAEVIPAETDGCGGDCKHCAGCASGHQSKTILAQNPVGAREGDWVFVSVKPDARIKAAAALYILPVVCFLFGYLLGEHLWQSGILISLCGLVLGFVLVKLLDRRMSKRGNAYIITGLAKGRGLNNTEKRG